MTDPDVVSGERDAAPREEPAVAPALDAASPAGYGARLARERQRAGMGVTDIAAQLRLHPDQVRAIEQENLARLPELPYVRGFIRGYARTLNIDPVPLLSDLNAKVAPAPDSETDDAGSGYAVERSAGRERSSRWVMGIAVAALIALGLLGWQTTQREVQTQAAPVVLAPAAPVATSAPAVTPAAEPVSPPAAEVTTPPVTVAETPASSKQTEAAPVPAAPVAASPVAAAPAATTAVAATPSRTETAPTLLLRFTGASWVEVTDARGQVLMSQLSTPGAEHVVEGDLPLNVLIGDATRTSVEVRGVAFNLLPIMRNNVARFTVK